MDIMIYIQILSGVMTGPCVSMCLCSIGKRCLVERSHSNRKSSLPPEGGNTSGCKNFEVSYGEQQTFLTPHLFYHINTIPEENTHIIELKLIATGGKSSF